MTTKLARLESILGNCGPLAVAISGGVDSMTLGVIAHRANPASHMYHAVSAAVPDQATQRVRHYAEQESWQLAIIDAGEINDQRYLENPVNRCYFCKTNLYDTIAAHTELIIASGTNTDDLGDYRPGLKAAREHQVIHPYVEADISKQELREIARSLGLHDLHELPAAPCLSSRVTTGIRIDPQLLPIVNQVEQYVFSELKAEVDIKAVRCRIRPDEVVLELNSIPAIDQQSRLAIDLTQSVATLFRNAGFAAQARSVSIEPYRMGSAFLIEAAQVD